MLKECKFCGQMVDVGDDEREGYYLCKCERSRREIYVQEQIDRAGDNIEILFGEYCEGLGYEPIRSEALVVVMKTLAALAARGEIGAASITIPGGGVAIVKLGSKGEVKVTRRVTNAKTLNAAAAY